MKTFLLKSYRLREKLRFFLYTWLRPQTLRNERARRELNRDLKAHWNHQLDVEELIHEQWERDSNREPKIKDDSYIVFIDHELDVDWITESNILPERGKGVSAAETIGARRCDHLPRKQVFELKRLVGQAIVCSIEGNLDESCELTKKAAEFLKARTEERSRLWTQVSAHLQMLIVCIFGLFIWGKGPNWLNFNNFFCIGVSGGLVGSYLSILLSAGKGSWDSSSGKFIHGVEVFTKLLMGALLGGIAVTITESIHCPPGLKAIAPDGYSIFILALAAGFIERLIPRMISKYSNNITE